MQPGGTSGADGSAHSIAIGVTSEPPLSVGHSTMRPARRERRPGHARLRVRAEAPAVLRLYLSDVRYGGRSQLFAIGIEGRDQADLRAFLPDAEQFVTSASAPITPA